MTGCQLDQCVYTNKLMYSIVHNLFVVIINVQHFVYTTFSNSLAFTLHVSLGGIIKHVPFSTRHLARGVKDFTQEIKCC